MKHLLAALICTVIGTSAYAHKSIPVKTLPAVKTVVSKLNENKGQRNQQNSDNKNQGNQFFRRQLAFVFMDSCGQQMTVWVSAGSSATTLSMEHYAYAYASNTTTADGCFPR